jgi:hypothetical protein
MRRSPGSKIEIDLSNDVRVIIFNSELNQTYDSASGEKINETCDGYILFVNDGPMNVSVNVFLK